MFIVEVLGFASLAGIAMLIAIMPMYAFVWFTEEWKLKRMKTKEPPKQEIKE